jgi:hypothetical protein
MPHPDPALLEACRTGSRDDVLSALRAFRETYLQGGPPPAELVEVLGACGEGLVAERGDPVLAILMFLFDVLMYVPAPLRTSARGPGAPTIAAIEAMAPRLLPLREASDLLVSAWSWHLLSWLPAPVPGLAAEALARLPEAQRSLLRITLALAAASTPEGRAPTLAVLTEWLDRPGEERDVAAMVLAQLASDPSRPETTSEAHLAALLSLAERGRWDEWEAAPAREHGYFADLASCLVRAGYARGDTTLPALVRLLDASAGTELENVLLMLLQLLYQSHPYEGDAVASALSPAQRSTLEALVRRPNVWLPRPRVYAALRDLGLPLGAAPMAAFLGIDPPAEGDVRVTSVEDSVVTLQTGMSPHELASALRGR